MKKNLLGVFTAVFALLIASGCGSSQESSGSEKSGGENAKSEKVHKIGINLELSGASSVWGVAQNNAINMLVEEINENGGVNGVPIELISYDNESSETQSLVVSKKLVEQDKVLAVIGGGTSPTAMPIVPYFEEKQVPLISTGSADQIVQPVEERKWIFKTPSNNKDIAENMVKFLKDHGKKDIAFMMLNNAYGESGLSSFEPVAKEAGLNIIAVEKFAADDQDMKPQLTQIKAKKPDAIVVWAIPPSASIVNKNYSELNMNSMLIYSNGAGSNMFIELAGEDAAEGTYVSAGKVWVADMLKDDDPQKEVISKYVEAYTAKYKEGVSPIDGMAYDAMLLLAKAIEQAGENVTRETVRDNLENLKDVAGITGVFNLSLEDHQGLKPEDILIVQVKDGKWVIPE